MAKHISHYTINTYDFIECNITNIMGRKPICNPITCNAPIEPITAKEHSQSAPLVNSSRLDTVKRHNLAYLGTIRQAGEGHTPPDGLGDGCNILLPNLSDFAFVDVRHRQ